MMKPATLERYSFLWSEARLIVAAAALFLGGVPPLRLVFPLMVSGYDYAGLLLTIGWIVSGVASLYLAYRWYAGGMVLFGKKDQKDMIAFLVSVVSGLNLGIVGLLGFNIGMSILSNYIVFVAVGVAYLVSAYYLYTRWNANGKKIF